MAWTKTGNLTGPQGVAGAAGAQGPQGPAGATGAQGSTGATGAAGQRGSLWFTGTGSPVGQTFTPTPQANDQYRDVSNGDVWTF